MRKNRITIFCNEFYILEAIIVYLNNKKIIKNILEINDKFDYPYCIIDSRIKNKEIDKILKSKFYNNYKLR